MSYKTNKTTVNSLVDNKVGVTIQGHSDNLDDLGTLDISTSAGKAVVVNDTNNGFDLAEIPETIIGKTIPMNLAFSLSDGWDAGEVLFTFIATESFTLPDALTGTQISYSELPDGATSSINIFKNDTNVGTFFIEDPLMIGFNGPVDFVAGDKLRLISDSALPNVDVAVTLFATKTATIIS